MTFWYAAEVRRFATLYGLDADLVTALCLTESSGKTNAYRYEPAFWRRYLAGKPEWAHENPERVSASYGLAQVMFPVAVEHGFGRNIPPERLFVPEVGVEYGCRVLQRNLQWSKGDIDAALAAYNGGKGGNAPGGPLRNQGYVTKVKAWLAKVQSGEVRYL